MVPLDDPGGPARVHRRVLRPGRGPTPRAPRAWSPTRGVVTSYEAHGARRRLAARSRRTAPAGHPEPHPALAPTARSWRRPSSWPGHSYMSTGFSTATEVHEFGGGERWGNLEKFQLVIDGREVNPVDRNIWGVTFVDDDDLLRHRRHRRQHVAGRGRPRRPHPDLGLRATPSARRCRPTAPASPSRSTSTRVARSCGRSPCRTSRRASAPCSRRARGARRPGRVARRRHPDLRDAARRRARRDRRLVGRHRARRHAAAAHRAGVVGHRGALARCGTVGKFLRRLVVREVPVEDAGDRATPDPTPARLSRSLTPG